jgi:hypothetical protein
MKALRRLALVALGVAAPACATARPAAEPEAAPSGSGVEVVNGSTKRVTIHYAVPGSNVSEYLGTVAGGGRRWFPLSEAMMRGGVFARTTDGRSVPREVRIHYIRR